MQRDNTKQAREVASQLSRFRFADAYAQFEQGSGLHALYLFESSHRTKQDEAQFEQAIAETTEECDA